MDESDWLAKRFEENRARLQAVAYRMLGAFGEADDAVQETWLRLNRSDASEIENLGGWLTTVVARVCLDMLRSRRSRGEQSMSDDRSGPSRAEQADPEADVLFADSIGPALLVVLDMLDPVERVAFVLHDLFDLPFEEIAPIVGRSEAATRQLASRARRRVRGTSRPVDFDAIRQKQIVTAFLAASRDGHFEALVGLLDADALLRADELAVQVATANRAHGAPWLDREVRGARAVAERLRGWARGASLALVDGVAGAVWAPAGRLRAAFVFSIQSEKIVEIEVVMDPARLGQLDVELVER
jgi:RNA polymerase sigma-70 factor (ECF subfamily)